MTENEALLEKAYRLTDVMVKQRGINTEKLIRLQGVKPAIWHDIEQIEGMTLLDLETPILRAILRRWYRLWKDLLEE